MTITANDRIAALEIACRAERDAVERAERAGNCVAAAINRQRVAVAESRLAADTVAEARSGCVRREVSQIRALLRRYDARVCNTVNPV